MGMQGLSIATSGLRVAHANLAITGHNMSNAEIRGFSRQRTVQKSAMVRDIGANANNERMMLGIGADRNAVQQLRNEFLDFTYRQNVGRLTFYSTVATVGREIENMLGELYGAFNFQSVINDMWYAIQELTRHPDGIATRQVLLSTAQTFINKANEVYQGLVQEQHNLNHQVIAAVNDINSLVARIHELNVSIRGSEMAGDNANDFRDARNLAIDQLAELIPIDIRVDGNGDVNITSMGHELLSGGVQTLMGLRFISADVDFVVPVLGTHGATISAHSPPDSFVNFMHLRPINGDNQNDFGRLHGLLLARGTAPANHMSNRVVSPDVRLDAYREALAAATDPDALAAAQARYDYLDTHLAAYRFNYQFHRWSIEHGMIPRVQQNLDNIVHAMVTLLNDALTGRLRETNPGFNPAEALDPAHPYYELLDGGRYRFVFPLMVPITDTADPDYPGLRPDPFMPAQPWDINVPAQYGGVPLFIRRHAPTGAEIDPMNTNTIYSIENLMINPALLQPGGHNLIAISMDRDAVNDTRVLQALQEIWRANDGPYVIDIAGRTFRIQEAYINMVNQISTDVNEAIRFAEAHNIQVIQADQRRLAIKGVSMDEELAAMLKFQYAFQAASRVINIIDGMIGILVNIGRN